MLESDATVANARTASETLSFIPIIAVMAILLIRIVTATSPSLTVLRSRPYQRPHGMR
jgi:hypothetical protein